MPNSIFSNTALCTMPYQTAGAAIQQGITVLISAAGSHVPILTATEVTPNANDFTMLKNINRSFAVSLSITVSTANGVHSLIMTTTSRRH